MEQRIKDLLDKRKEQGLLRELIEATPGKGGRISVKGRECVNFSSNDYLALSSHPDLAKAARTGLKMAAGSASSRLMTGSTKVHHELERRVARFKRKPVALVFNSGYQANIGIISALCGRADAIFSDKLNHASIVDGIRLSGAKLFRFRHNDIGHLERLLQKERKKFSTALIITETVFSMDGDLAPLEDIVELKNKHNCILMADEAHATGIYGKRGSGLAEETATTGDIDIIMGTFSKALGSFGSYAATSRQIREYLVNTCRSFIYSTSLPPSVISANIAAIDIVKKEKQRRKKLLANAGYLRVSLKKRGYTVLGGSQIVPVVLGDNDAALALGGYLRKEGYWVTPVRPPTVPKGKARLRISITSDHSRGTIDKFLESLDKYGEKN